MFSSGHFFSGVILAEVLSKFVPLTFWEMALIALTSVFIPDLDYLYYRFNHRFSPFHSLGTPLVIAMLGFLDPIFFFMALSVVLHLLIDSLDAGVMWLYPFNKKLYGLFLAKSEPKAFFGYLKDYVRSPFMYLEVLFVIVAIALLFV